MNFDKSIRKRIGEYKFTILELYCFLGYLLIFGEDVGSQKLKIKNYLNIVKKQRVCNIFDYFEEVER